MQNKYPGNCGKCGELVEANQGIAQKIKHKWTVFHKDCWGDWQVDVANSHVNPDDYNTNVKLTKIQATLEAHLTDIDPIRAAFAKQLYEDFFGTLIPEDEIPF